MIALYDASLLGLLALAFALGFGAGWWTAIGTAWLIIKFILFGMSDRSAIPPYGEEIKPNAGHGLDNFIPVMFWPSMWSWPVRHKDIRNAERVRESAHPDEEALSEREM